ncbi:MAG: tagaturonate epimerase family protein [Desulfofustis sp.]
MKLEKYSFGTGDRFGKQADAQLQAVRKAKEQGVDIAIVWNKSHREHLIVGSSQADLRKEADAAVKKSGWPDSYYVDADHINLSNVDGFLNHSDFFTIDVADYIGEPAEEKDLERFVDTCSMFSGRLHIEGIDDPLNITREKIQNAAEKYLAAIQKAAEIYHYIESVKGKDRFITEVSLDETEEPQTPEELLFILAALADQKIPAQTIAPKFTGRFNKGIDYQGDVDQFNREFSDDICVIRHAVSVFDLPVNLKLSVHSGSDKFSIYPGIRKAIDLHDAGVHVKTAGTTWLEELIGLAASGGTSLDLVKDIYAAAFDRFDELCGPYASVIDIDRDRLPSPETFSRWDEQQIVGAVRHDMSCSDYDKNIRQLLHVGYKVAAEYGTIYLQALDAHKDIIGKHVFSNLFEKHITPLFL